MGWESPRNEGSKPMGIVRGRKKEVNGPGSPRKELVYP